MTRYIADFDVEAELLVLNDESRLHWSHPDGSTQLQIKNRPLIAPAVEQLLGIQVILEAPDLKEAEEQGRDRLLLFLDAMSVTTNTRFRLRRLVRVLDWTPGLTMRDFRLHTPGPPHQLFGLDDDLLRTVSRIAAVQEGPLARALNCFRRGNMGDMIEEQFQYFWYAIEIVAELVKKTDRVPDSCPRCDGPLFCPACNEVPMHRPFAKQAILALIRAVVDIDPDATFRMLADARNLLLHGESVETIEHKLGKPFADIVDSTARIAWIAIVNSLRLEPGEPLKVLDVNRHTRMEATLVLVGSIGSPPLEGCPDIDAVTMPLAKFEMGPVPRHRLVQPPPPID